MLCVGANAVTQLKELANAPGELRGVVGGSILPADIFYDDNIESVKSRSGYSKHRMLQTSSVMGEEQQQEEDFNQEDVEEETRELLAPILYHQEGSE
ncbi:MAG: hypothetical protein EZS28_008915 [Streblomastix strix]|uniref:Uncharacterized protein n=1 Tax=Streblomastix strix TaxID=222440 RepID=A0A5J4WL61_9EUKA|nr:MAG: hypothetical protein EZS28_008915 [Streblomastix strix]